MIRHAKVAITKPQSIISFRRANDPPTRRYAAFRLRHPVEDRSAVFALTRANGVAAMMRNLTARVADEQGRTNEWIDRYVHGHREKDDPALPRFSYLPLPSIEHRRADALVLGAIRRVLVAELLDSGPSDLPWVRQMLPGQFLTGDRRTLLTPLTGKDWVLRRYTDPSDLWATVTPLVLPGSDDGKFAKAEKLFFKTLRHAGYSPDALAELEFGNGSFWPGGEWALSFQRPDYLRNGQWSVYHVRLRWKQSINGPLAIGAGRHCGLGIFATMHM
jgi:CRISPR-associated protein Csb2